MIGVGGQKVYEKKFSTGHIGGKQGPGIVKGIWGPSIFSVDLDNLYMIL